MPDLDFSLPTANANLVAPPPLVPQPARHLLRPLPEAGEFLLVLDNTSLEHFTTCPKSAHYRLVLGREAHAKNAALVFGGAIHEGLEALLLGKPVGDQDQAVAQYFINNPPPIDEWRTLTNALDVLRAYRQRATLPDYEWEIQSDEDGPIIERAFELPLGVIEVNADVPTLAGMTPTSFLDDRPVTFVSRIHLAWSGRIDAVARCGNPCGARVVDHKTGKVEPQEYAISNPVLGYVWAARQLWPDLDVRGFCLNALSTRKPAGGCTMSSRGPRGGESALTLSRNYFDYSLERLDEWAENVRHIVSDFVHCLVRDYYPRHTKWCMGKYGPCQYHVVCTQDNPAVRRNMLLSDMFKPVTWNPTDGR